MSVNRPIDYCPHCKQNVPLKRPEFDCCLALILGIFTVGIGLLIYICIYLNKEPDRCSYCFTILRPSLPYQQRPQLANQNSSQVSQDPFFAQPSQRAHPIQAVRATRTLYCPLCGFKIENRNVEYCPNCGSKMD